MFAFDSKNTHQSAQRTRTPWVPATTPTQHLFRVPANLPYLPPIYLVTPPPHKCGLKFIFPLLFSPSSLLSGGKPTPGSRSSASSDEASNFYAVLSGNSSPRMRRTSDPVPFYPLSESRLTSHGCPPVPVAHSPASHQGLEVQNPPTISFLVVPFYAEF